MKKFSRAICLSLFIGISCVSQTARGYDFDDTGYCFDILTDVPSLGYTVKVTYRYGSTEKQAGYANGNRVIPEEVTYSYTDYKHDHITKTYKVVQIGGDAFNGCKYMTSISIPETITKIGDGAFQYCEGLESIVIPNSVISVGKKVFANCPNLREVTLGTSVKMLGGQDMFFRSKNIKAITCLSTEPPICNWNWNGFAGWDIEKIATLYVPIGCKEIYANDSFWGHFQNIEEIETSSVDDITFNERTIRVSGEQGAIIIEGLNENEVISIYDIHGKTVYQGKNRSISNLSSGLYIISVSNKAIKYILR